MGTRNRVAYSTGMSNNTTPTVEQNAASIINSYGEGDHPWADADGIRFFAPEYIVACAKKALAACPARADDAQAVIDRYSEAK